MVIVRSVVLTLMLVTGCLSVHAQTPAPNPEQTPAGKQAQWVIETANGQNNLTDLANLEAHFDHDFLHSVGADELYEFAYNLVRMYAPVTVTGLNVTEDGTVAIASLRARDGTQLILEVRTNPESGLINYITVKLADAGTPESTPISSDPMATWEEIGASYSSRYAEVEQTGEAFLTRLLAEDSALFTDSSLSPALVQALDGTSVETVLHELTQNRVHVEFPEVGAILDGHWNGDTISGFFVQGSVLSFHLTADNPQTGDVPTGSFSGEITEIGLAFSMHFTGNLNATLTIPAQGLQNHPMSNVSFEAERPLGARIDARALLMGGQGTAWRALLEWGNGALVVNIGVAEDNTISALTLVPQWSQPIPPSGTTLKVQAPFGGAWLTIWGGDSEFLNYHVVAPQQAFALDLVIWQAGATFHGDGLEVEDYYAWGQPYYAPVSGEVVAVVNDQPDIPPQIALQKNIESAAAVQTTQPAGNHVVIQTDGGAFVFLAHMQHGSVLVSPGDVVEVGDQVGLVGNSGNTSEPHIHIHAQTSSDLMDPNAVGIPLYWVGVTLNGEPVESAWPEQGDIVEAIREV